MIRLEAGFKHKLVEGGRLLSGGSYKDIWVKIDCISKKLTNVETNHRRSLNFARLGYT